MTLYNPFFKFLSPRNSGLITFKGGGGGASVEEVQTVVDNSVGTASESGTVTGNTVGFTLAPPPRRDPQGPGMAQDTAMRERPGTRGTWSSIHAAVGVVCSTVSGVLTRLWGRLL